MNNINFYRGKQYPEIQSVISKKYYHGVLTVNLAIFDFGLLTTFSTEKDGVLFSEVIGTESGGLSIYGLFCDTSFESKESNYTGSFEKVKHSAVLANEDAMKDLVGSEEFDGLSYSFGKKSIYCFLTKRENSEFGLYAMFTDEENDTCLMGESLVKLSYDFQ